MGKLLYYFYNLRSGILILENSFLLVGSILQCTDIIIFYTHAKPELIFQINIVGIC